MYGSPAKDLEMAKHYAAKYVQTLRDDGMNFDEARYKAIFEREVEAELAEYLRQDMIGDQERAQEELADQRHQELLSAINNIGQNTPAAKAARFVQDHPFIAGILGMTVYQKVSQTFKPD